MRLTNFARWLLVAMLVAGCTGAAETPGPETGTDFATATVAALAAVSNPPASTPASMPAPNGGGATMDEPTPPAATVDATAAAAPSPAAGAAQTPTARAATPTGAAPTTSPTEPVWSTEPHSLQIEVMRQQGYPGSPITVEQTLKPGANYSRAIVSYNSAGYKIYALLTIPDGTMPAAGWPAIVFNHGYVSPAVYQATERYVAYVDAIARSGYIVFVPDYRGWGSSDGGMVVGGGYGAPDLTVDVLNALASLQAHPEVDPNRIGMWGHSLGGQLTLRAMVVANDIRAGVIWGGVVAPYPAVIAVWGRLGRDAPGTPLAQPGQYESYEVAWIRSFTTWVQDFSSKYGTDDQNPAFWATISPNTYLADLSGPIALHHSTTDEMTPLAWAETLAEELKAVDTQPFEFYTYPGDNHNISANFGVAMQRTLAFFDQYVKDQP